MTSEQIATGSDACEVCADELTSNPFLALRVAYGMLLGEDDFRVLMGNPRGKQMLHSAWLHRSGVVWGFEVGVDGTRTLTVSPGLAVDGIGRELLQDVTWCANLRDWVDKHVPSREKDCDTWTVCACLQVEFDCDLTCPVPTIADPCDVTRKHDDYSRIVEHSRLVLLPNDCECRVEPYHRTRVLLGLDDVGNYDPEGQEALAAQAEVAAKPLAERPQALLASFRKMSTLDAASLRPAQQAGTGEPTLYPVLSEEAAVVLANVEIDVRDADGCLEICAVRVDTACRKSLLPTATIQELLCGLAPGLVGAADEADAGGPRVIAESVSWPDGGAKCRFSVTAALNPGSLRRAIRITSLSERGWIDEDIYAVRLADAGDGVEIELADPPANDIVRLIIKGTGRHRFSARIRRFRSRAWSVGRPVPSSTATTPS